MRDPFLDLVSGRKPGNEESSIPAPAVSQSAGAGHAVRKHSKFSASGSERWINCSGSVALSEGMPDKPNVWAEEGTLAHEVLEAFMLIELSGNDGAVIEEHAPILKTATREMVQHAVRAARFIIDLGLRLNAKTEVETRIHLDFIHPEMFGTFDGAVIDHFGTLHVFDYKYGAGHAVSARENLQMIFYGMGLAHLHHWNFKTVRLWIIQPRIRGYDGPTFWEVPIKKLKSYVKVFEEGVERVLNQPDKFVEGPWCHWCKGKSKCPLKMESKLAIARKVFAMP